MKKPKNNTPSSPQSPIITEGLAKIHNSPNTFYNPSQELNRSLSVLIVDYFLSSFPPENSFSFFESMSASGIRSIRYLSELSLPPSYTFTINDISSSAVSLIRENLLLNNINTEKEEKNKIVIKESNAINTLLSSPASFDCIDLDPYGSPSEFIYPSLFAVKDGGLLCITATDMITLCSKQSEVVFKRYNSIPSRSVCAKEIAIRIVIGDINRVANKMGKEIEVVFSAVCGFYIKAFIKVRSSKKGALEGGDMMKNIAECKHCGGNKLFLVSKGVGGGCEFCGENMTFSGPVYSGRLFSEDFNNYLKDYEKIVSRYKENFGNIGSEDIVGFARGVCSEVDVPLFYNINNVSKELKVGSPQIVRVISSLLKKGFSVSRSHVDAAGIKTNAGIKDVYSLVFNYAKVRGGVKDEEEKELVKRAEKYGVGEEEFDFKFDEEINKKVKMVKYLDKFKACPKKSVVRK